MVFSITKQKVYASPTFSLESRVLWGRKIYTVLEYVNNKEPLSWKADILLDLANWNELKKVVKKFRSYYPKEKAPSFMMLETARKSGKFNLHIVGRGEITKKELREVLITALCKNKTRLWERKEASRSVDVHFELVENTEEKNINALLNYTCKTSERLVKKLVPSPKRKRNYCDLGLLGHGGIKKQLEEKNKEEQEEQEKLVLKEEKIIKKPIKRHPKRSKVELTFGMVKQFEALRRSSRSLKKGIYIIPQLLQRIRPP